jgi:hypothetical protein
MLVTDPPLLMGMELNQQKQIAVKLFRRLHDRQ